MIELPTQDEPVKVVCADALDVLRELPDRCVDAVVTDPPYGTGWARTSSGSPVGVFVGVNERPEWDVWNLDWLRESRRVARGGAFFIPRSRLADSLAVLPHARPVFYVKTNPRPCGPSVEPVLVWGDMRSPSGDIHAYNGDTPLHPCQKPLDVMRWLVAATDPADLILDPFGGSGTTAVAALHEGRRCLIVEKDPAYCDVIRRRVADAMGVGRGSFLAPAAGLFDDC